MFKIIYTKKSRDIIRMFIKSYKNTFLKVYTDTGIYYENIIRDNYIENSRKFFNEVKNNIKQNLGEDIILGYKPLEDKLYQIVIRTGNYRLFIEYSEKINKKERIIENIKFYYK